MVPPERRLPGYVLVLLLVLVGALVAVFVAVYRPGPILGPPFLLVTAVDRIAGQPEGVRTPADFGPHCADWHRDPDGFWMVESDARLEGVEGLVLQRYEPTTANFDADALGDATRERYLVNGSGWVITSPVDERVLARLQRVGENVSFEPSGSGPSSHGPGVTWSHEFAYDVPTANGVLRITESVDFRNEGIITPHIVPQGACA